MSEHMFGVTRVAVSAREAIYLDATCVDEGGTGFVMFHQAGSDIRGWFTADNRGVYWNDRTRESVMARVTRERPELARKCGWV